MFDDLGEIGKAEEGIEVIVGSVALSNVGEYMSCISSFIVTSYELSGLGAWIAAL